MMVLLLLSACGISSVPKDESPGTGIGGEELWSCDSTGTRAPRQLRLLNRREYQHTVRDLFGLGTGASCTEDIECNLETESCTAGTCTADPCGTGTFVLADAGYGAVHVAGSFNGWPGSVAAGGWAMAYDATGDRWWLKAELGEGSFQYKYVIDESTWIADPTNPNQADDGFGGYNSLLTLSCDGAGLDDIATLDLTAAFPVESRPQHYAFDNNAAAGLVSATLADAQLDAAEAVAGLAVLELERLSGCNPADDSCAEAFLRDFGARAWRRPLTEAQVQRLMSLLRAESDRSEGFSLAIQAVLSSPYFVYRSEIGVDQGDGSYRLDAWEQAAAMSYFYWGTMPDAALFAAAAAGELEDKAGIQSQAERLLADPRARDTLATFAQQWLGVEAVRTTQKSEEFPDDVREAMLAEVGDFYTHVLLDSSGRLPELYTADYTIVNPTLAAWYGLESPGSDGVVANAERAGILGMGAVAATYAHSDQTSPIRRGLFIREALLCQSLGTPPANAASVPTVDPNATTRERFSQHSADPFCAGCHQYIDEVGFGMERLDTVGRWREEENGFPIDAVGNMNDIEKLGNRMDHPYQSLPELGELLSASERVNACFSVQVMRFALGWDPEEDPLCAFDPQRQVLLDNDLDMRALLLSVPTSNAFRIRE